MKRKRREETERRDLERIRERKKGEKKERQREEDEETGMKNMTFLLDDFVQNTVNRHGRS